MSIYYQPKSLTMFYKTDIQNYVIFNIDEKYEVNGIETDEETQITKRDETFFKKITGKGVPQSKEERLKIPKFIRIKSTIVDETYKQDGTLISYDPLKDTPNLYTEMAKIEYFDTPSLLKFIQNFGLPMGDDLFSTENYKVAHFKLNLFEFYFYLYHLKQTINVYEAIITNDRFKLNRYAKKFEEYVSNEFKSAGLNYLETLKNTNKTDNRPDLTFKKEELKRIQQAPDIVKEYFGYSNSKKDQKTALRNQPVIDQVNHYLVELLNDLRKGDSSFRIIKNKRMPGTTFYNLTEVAYYQVSRHIAINGDFKRCEYDKCGAIFEVTHESRRFCPPLPGNKISTCQNSYNQRMKRKRRKVLQLIEKGLSIPEIASNVHLSEKDITDYIKTKA